MGVNYNPQIATNGLVMSLDAANLKSYIGSGSTWSDISGNNNNATLLNAPTFSTTNGGTLVFDGTNETANCGNVTVSTSSISASAWVYDTDTAGGYRDIITKNGQFRFRIDNNAEGGGLSAFVWISGVGAEPRITTTWTKNVWANVAFTWNTDGNFRLFVNGILRTSSSTRSGTASSSSGNMFVGSVSSTINMWNGNISQALLYNRTLTDEEIFKNFQAQRGRYGI